MNHESDAKKIRVNELRPNYVLARDVVTKSGVVILAKNTMLNSVNYTKLNSNDVVYVYVLENSIDESLPFFDKEVHTIEEQMEPVFEKQEFKGFENAYKENFDEAKSAIDSAVAGEIKDKGQTYEIVKNIIQTVNCKSDIFSYMGYLKNTGEYTYTHSLNVSILCNLFSKWLGMSDEETEDLTVAGLLHDVGKTKISQEILNKKGRLTPEEFEEVKRHTLIGYEIVKDMDIPEEIKLAVLMHHEKINGTGYPKGLKGADISKYARIVAICDIYEAMTADRTYRDRICPFTVIRNFERENFGILDTEFLLTFLQNIAYTYVGSWVKLTDDTTAEIVFINKSQMSRPIVKSGDDYIDLSKKMDLDIKFII